MNRKYNKKKYISKIKKLKKTEEKQLKIKKRTLKIMIKEEHIKVKNFDLRMNIIDITKIHGFKINKKVTLIINIIP